MKRFGFTLAAALLLLALPAGATDRTADSPAVADIQAKVNLSSAGDRVIVPAGSATWNSGLTINIGITLDMRAGPVITRGSGSFAMISVNTEAVHSFVMLSGTLVDTDATGNLRTFSIAGSSFSNAKFIVYGTTFVNANPSITFVDVVKAWGVFSRCTMTGGKASEMIHNLGWGTGEATSGWTDDITPGGPDALYVEDCWFFNGHIPVGGDPYFWGTAPIQSYYGARTVFRNNYCWFVHVDQHGTPGAVGARWWEIYDNTFDVPLTGSPNISNFLAIRAGSGVITGNRIIGGVNYGAGTISLFEEDAGYPALYQIGRGKNQALDPAYCWDNDVLATAGSDNVVDGRDMFSNTPKPGWTRYTYPNPLVSAYAPVTATPRAGRKASGLAAGVLQ